jgi:hypothetical protein
MNRHVLVPAALLALTACSETPKVNLGGNYAVALSMPPIANHDIDVLFVVDNSGSMQDNQEAVAARAQEALFDVIGNAVGGPPDLHVGVITSNIGAGEDTIPNCAGDGDGGRLQNHSPQVGSCAGLTDHFLIDVAGEGGARTQNYSGTLADAFGCIVQVGAQGCGFEQPLGALELAVSGNVPENAGFLRPGALLVVIILTDEDDCTASDPNTLFDADDVVTLGALTSFRCFAQSVTCDQEDLGAAGEKTNCVARDDSAYIAPLQRTVDALVAAKGGDASQIMVAAIAAPTTPVLVGSNGFNPSPAVLASCVDANQDVAAPAIRLEQLLHAFPGRSWFESICGDVAPALRHTANLVGDVAARRPCLRGNLRDTDASKPGVQPSCRAFAVAPGHVVDETSTELPACDGDGDAPCFRLSTDTDACGDDGALGLRADAVNATLDSKNLVVACLVP